jgi:hypothetical protein
MHVADIEKLLRIFDTDEDANGRACIAGHDHLDTRVRSDQEVGNDCLDTRVRSDQDAYKIWIPSTNKIIMARDVIISLKEM